jgi:SAM-dependent MidA family methyltransferase
MPLPGPSPEALAHSRRLFDLIISEIQSAGGWISFVRYMDLALYAPGLGYYTGAAQKFGIAGDFVTAPEISPLFGRCLARQLAAVLADTGGSLLELGAGTGNLAIQLLPELDRLKKLPERYAILELSPELRDRQQQAVLTLPSDLACRVVWLDTLPERFTGVVFGNEVLDAIPVHLVRWNEGDPVEMGVVAEKGNLAWGVRPPSDASLLAAASRLELPPGYISEINLSGPALIRSLGDRLDLGLLLFIDYGFGRAEYYHPQRGRGTLMCHYRHRAHDNPFLLPGLQDITAHVDFTAVAEAGVEVGLRLLGYTSQANFLISCGITELLAQSSPSESASYLPQAAAAQKLLSPSEMGELFKAIALGRGITEVPLGFRQGDLRRLL